LAHLQLGNVITGRQGDHPFLRLVQFHRLAGLAKGVLGCLEQQLGMGLDCLSGPIGWAFA
jgi:hypothetical protein